MTKLPPHSYLMEWFRLRPEGENMLKKHVLCARFCLNLGLIIWLISLTGCVSYPDYSIFKPLWNI